MPVAPAKNWSVVKVQDGKVVKHLFVGLTKQEAEGAAKAGNLFNRKKGVTNVFFKIIEDVKIDR